MRAAQHPLYAQFEVHASNSTAVRRTVWRPALAPCHGQAAAREGAVSTDFSANCSGSALARYYPSAARRTVHALARLMYRRQMDGRRPVGGRGSYVLCRYSVLVVIASWW
jgi:hypothetical protein